MKFSAWCFREENLQSTGCSWSFMHAVEVRFEQPFGWMTLNVHSTLYILFDVLLIYFADKEDKNSIMYAIARPRRCPDNELIYFTTNALTFCLIGYSLYKRYKGSIKGKYNEGNIWRPSNYGKSIFHGTFLLSFFFQWKICITFSDGK